MEKRNSQLEHRQPIACFARATQVWLAVNYNISRLSLLANELDVRSVLHGQMSLAAVNQICDIHEVVN